VSDIQRERAEMLATDEASSNLSLMVFARLAGKSRDQINRDIKARLLLSLSLGNRGQRIPDCHEVTKGRPGDWTDPADSDLPAADEETPLSDDRR
jgi:hypothetical protein